MPTARFAAADNQGKLKLPDALDNLLVVEGIHIDIDSTPEAGVLLVDRHDADTHLALQVGLENGLGPWFADNLVYALLLSVGVFFGEIDGTIGAVEATENASKSVCGIHNGKKGRISPPPVILERHVVVGEAIPFLNVLDFDLSGHDRLGKVLGLGVEVRVLDLRIL